MIIALLTVYYLITLLNALYVILDSWRVCTSVFAFRVTWVAIIMPRL